MTKGAPLSTENPIITFVASVDSFRLTAALQRVLFETAEGLLRPIADGTNREEPRLGSDLIRLAALGRLLATCTAQTAGRYEDPVVCFVRDTIVENPGALLAVLPLAIVWIREVNAAPVTAAICDLLAGLRYKATRVNRVAIRLLLDTCASRDNDRVGGGDAHAASVFGRTLDEDAVSTERMLAFVLPEFRAWQLELAQVNVDLRGDTAAPEVAPTAPRSAPPTRPVRKVRPTTENGSAMQRKLRQWFWWQHPSLKELGDGLARHLVAEAVELTEAVAVLRRVVPEVVPRSLATGRMIEIVIALILEATREQLRDTQ